MGFYLSMMFHFINSFIILLAHGPFSMLKSGVMVFLSSCLMSLLDLSHSPTSDSWDGTGPGQKGSGSLFKWEGVNCRPARASFAQLRAWTPLCKEVFLQVRCRERALTLPQEPAPFHVLTPAHGGALWLGSFVLNWFIFFFERVLKVRWQFFHLIKAQPF